MALHPIDVFEIASRYDRDPVDQADRDVVTLLDHLGSITAPGRMPDPLLAMVVLHALTCSRVKCAGLADELRFEHQLVKLAATTTPENRAYLGAGFPLLIAFTEMADTEEGRGKLAAIVAGAFS